MPEFHFCIIEKVPLLKIGVTNEKLFGRYDYELFCVI